jgi:hypothetical protein
VRSIFSKTLIGSELRPASYGSLARFKDIQRLHSVGDHTVVGASGDMSDFQYIQSILDELIVDEFTAGDGHTLGPAEIHEYLSQVMYARRSKINPLWNALLVGGVKDGKRCVYTARALALDIFLEHSKDSCPSSICLGRRTLHLLSPPDMVRILLNLF